MIYRIRLILGFIILVFVFISCENGTEDIKRRVLVDIGDSLTAGAGGSGITMSLITDDQLSEGWDVINMGVGGENTLTIGARYGAIPMYVPENVSIPKDGSLVELPYGLKSTFNGENVAPLLQGDKGINPCFIDGIECELIRSNDKYYIRSVYELDQTHITSNNAIVNTRLSKIKASVATIFIGQNGGYDTPTELLEQIDAFVEHHGNEKFIIITSHGNGTEENVAMIREKYGDKHIDLKKYMSTEAINDAIDAGYLIDDGTYPPQEDLDRMNNGDTPYQLLVDGIHFNSIGYRLLGELRYQRGVQLGYW